MREPAPVFNQFNLVVKDMEATLSFYRRLGLTIRDADPTWAKHHRNAVQPNGIDLDFDSIEFAQKWDKGWPGPKRGGMGVLGFQFASREAVDATYSDLVAAGYKAQQAPYDAFWGSRYAVVEDPDGNAVGLMSPREPERQKQTTSP